MCVSLCLCLIILILVAFISYFFSSARWQSAAQIYQSYQSSRTHSRAHSPAADGFHEAFMYPPSLTPALISDHISTVYNIFGYEL